MRAVLLWVNMFYSFAENQQRQFDKAKGARHVPSNVIFYINVILYKIISTR